MIGPGVELIGGEGSTVLWGDTKDINGPSQMVPRITEFILTDGLACVDHHSSWLPAS
jgi:hypothetical protein